MEVRGHKGDRSVRTERRINERLGITEVFDRVRRLVLHEDAIRRDVVRQEVFFHRGRLRDRFACALSARNDADCVRVRIKKVDRGVQPVFQHPGDLVSVYGGAEYDDCVRINIGGLMLRTEHIHAANEENTESDSVAADREILEKPQETVPHMRQ